MNEEQEKRLEELLGKSELTDVESTELSELQALETDTKGAEPKEEAPEIVEEKAKEEEALSEEEAKALVTESVKEANEEIKEAITEVAEKALTVDEIADSVSEKISEENAKALTLEKVEAIVTKALKEKSTELDEDSVKKLINNQISDIKGESKMKHDAADTAKVSIPLGDRKGNLPVHQKQLLNIMTGKAQDEDIPEGLLHDAKSLGDRRIDAIRSGRKDLTTDGSEPGTHLTPTDLSSVLQERLYVESAVAAAFASQEINMPSNPFKLPVATARPAFTRHTTDIVTATADTQQATANVTLDAEKMVSYVQYSYELDEDSIVAVLPMITNQLAGAAAEAFEDNLINGQVSGAIDDSYTASNYICDGLRRMAEQVAGIQYNVNGPVEIADLVGARKVMGKWGTRPADTVLITSYKAYNDIVALDQVTTLDKIGSSASITSGVVPQIFGMDVIPSAALLDTVGDNGLVTDTPGNNIKGQFLMVYKPAFAVGVRRDFTVETDRDIQSQSNKVVASFRRDFQPLEAVSASVTPIAWGQNVT